MPGVISEFFRSRGLTGDFDNSRQELVYKITQTDDYAEAYSLLIAAAPASVTIDGNVLSKRVFSCDPEDYMVWTGTVSYSKRRLEEGESNYQFETGGGTTHITHSIATIQSVRAGGGTAANFYNAIGWSGSEIAGCEIVSPNFTFSETHVLPGSAVDGAYKLALFNATGKVNNGTFKGFAAGEVLFLGASGSQRQDGSWEITYRFAASANATGLSIGGLTGLNKKGWEYLWIHYEDESSEDLAVKKPVQANVEQVYATTSFSALGIGT
jgi:hypothetical protein